MKKPGRNNVFSAHFSIFPLGAGPIPRILNWPADNVFKLLCVHIEDQAIPKSLPQPDVHFKGMRPFLRGERDPIMKNAPNSLP
jgi:hypothetical protein